MRYLTKTLMCATKRLFGRTPRRFSRRVPALFWLWLRPYCASAVLLSPACLMAHLAMQPGNPTLKLTPDVIEMGTFYGQTLVRAQGTVESGSKVVVVVRGADAEEVFNKKERVGPIWVNSGKVQISGVPSLFLCFTPAPVSTFLNESAIKKHQLDEAAFKEQMRIEPRGIDRETIQAHYLKLKREQGSYQVANTGVQMGHSSGEAGVDYAVEFVWPKKAPPGTYEVKVYECRGGAVVRDASTSLRVAEVGFPAEIAFLAREHASFYGALCVIVAMMAGFGIDFLAARLSGKKQVAAH